MIALGLVLLVVAVVVAIAGIFTNLGSSHQLGRTVDLLGYHLQGSTGKLLLVGIIIGAIGMLGLNMLLAGIGRGFKRTISQRKERREERRQTKTVVQDRDRLAGELEREQARRQVEQERMVRPVDRVDADAADKSRVGAYGRNDEQVRPTSPASTSELGQPDVSRPRDL